MKTFIIAAVSTDGYIAREAGQLADWTSKEDKKVFVNLTKQAGVMIMGSTTYKTIGKALPGRRNIVYSHHAIDQEGIETVQEDPASLLARLQAEGHDQVAICGGQAIYDLFLQAGLVDELYLTVEPVLFGAGIPLLRTSTDTRLHLLESKTLNDDVLLLHYEVEK